MAEWLTYAKCPASGRDALRESWQGREGRGPQAWTPRARWARCEHIEGHAARDSLDMGHCPIPRSTPLFQLGERLAQREPDALPSADVLGQRKQVRTVLLAHPA